MSAVLHIKVDLGSIGPIPSSLFTQKSSFKHGYFEEGATVMSHWKGATLFRVKDMEYGNKNCN
jgi:hypothetical protein